MSSIALWRSVETLSPREIVASSNELAFELLAAHRNTKGNVVIAPPLLARTATPVELVTDGDVVSLRARWALPFPPEATREGVFFTDVLEDEVAIVPTMRRRFQAAGFLEGRAVQVLELAYAGSLACAFFLPRRANGLRALEAQLSPLLLEKCSRALRPRDVEVTLPRATISSRLDVGVEHAARFSLDEGGSGSAGSRRPSCPPEDPRVPTFTADHPFVFVVRGTRSGLIVLIGRFERPD